MTKVAAVKQTKAGIGFTVCVDFIHRECFISNEALIKLGEQMYSIIGPMPDFSRDGSPISAVWHGVWCMPA